MGLFCCHSVFVKDKLVANERRKEDRNLVEPPGLQGTG